MSQAFLQLELSYVEAIEALLRASPAASGRGAPSLRRHVALADDIDPRHGMHGYVAVLLLRSFGETLWSGQFDNIECTEQATKSAPRRLTDEHEFVLLGPTASGLETCSQAPALHWAGDAFGGVLDGGRRRPSPAPRSSRPKDPATHK